MKRKHKKRIKLLPLPKLYKKARRIFAAWIVRRDKGICFTCGKPGNQAGHFIHRNSLDFNEKANNCQCVACNHFRRGNLAVYAERLEKKYGYGIIQELNQLSHQIKKFTRAELEEKIKKYKEY